MSAGARIGDFKTEWIKIEGSDYDPMEKMCAEFDRQDKLKAAWDHQCQDKRELHRIDQIPDWRERNDVAPGVRVYDTLELALEEIQRHVANFPIVEASDYHSLRIDLYQPDNIFAGTGLTRLPGRYVFCSTPELRRRVLAAMIESTLSAETSSSHNHGQLY